MRRTNHHDESGAAIVCSHVARLGYSILYAHRDAPMEAVDSGWQFLCSGEPNHADDVVGGCVWSINDVLRTEPTLRPMLRHPIGTWLARPNSSAPWESHAPHATTRRLT